MPNEKITSVTNRLTSFFFAYFNIFIAYLKVSMNVFIALKTTLFFQLQVTDLVGQCFYAGNSSKLLGKWKEKKYIFFTFWSTINDVKADVKNSKKKIFRFGKTRLYDPPNLVKRFRVFCTYNNIRCVYAIFNVVIIKRNNQFAWKLDLALCGV